MRKPTFDLIGEPYQTIYWCPICGDEIHRTDVGTVDLSVEAQETERDATEHMRRSHPFRFRLWERFRWNRLLGV